MTEEEQEIQALALVRQIAGMITTQEADGRDLENDDAMDGLIARAREIAGQALGYEELTD